jgi:bacterioferritin-associated ferredoxin
VYEGVTLQEIDDTVERAIYAHSNIQQKIEKKTHCSKCGEWLEYDSASYPECDHKSK